MFVTLPRTWNVTRALCPLRRHARGWMCAASVGSATNAAATWDAAWRTAGSVPYVAPGAVAWISMFSVDLGPSLASAGLAPRR
jgi:hypothetical protein